MKMKSMNFKWLALLLCIILSVSFAAACNGDDPVDTNPADSGAVTEPSTNSEEGTNGSFETEADTEAETQTPAVMDEAAVKEALNQAFTATEAKAAYTVTAQMDYATQGTPWMTMAMVISTDGSNHIYSVDVSGAKTVYTILSDAVYIEDSLEGESYLTVIALTEEQRAELLLELLGEEDEALANDADQFMGLAGTQMSDGSIEITATDLSEDVKNMLGENAGQGMADVSVSVSDCKITIGTDGLLSSVSMIVSIDGSVDGVEGDAGKFEMSMTVAMDYNYDSVTISAPENQDAYVSETYDVYFGYAPDAESALAFGMPLDAESYVIGEENSELDADSQFLMAAMYPWCYENKTFTLYGHANTDEETGADVVWVSENSFFYVYYPAGVSAPGYNDVVKITATFEQTVDKGRDSDFTCFTMMVQDIEILEKANKGPNGGTYMYVTASALNVRSEPDSSKDNKVGLLYNGDIVEVLETGFGDNSNWAKIVFEDAPEGVAYISMSYLSETQP